MTDIYNMIGGSPYSESLKKAMREAADEHYRWCDVLDLASNKHRTHEDDRRLSTMINTLMQERTAMRLALMAAGVTVHGSDETEAPHDD